LKHFQIKRRRREKKNSWRATEKRRGRKEKSARIGREKSRRRTSQTSAGATKVRHDFL